MMELHCFVAMPSMAHGRTIGWANDADIVQQLAESIFQAIVSAMKATDGKPAQ